jgi:Helix-turn-helix domain
MHSDIVPLPPVEATRGYSVNHSSLYLGTSPPGVYTLLREGKLVSRTIGKRRIIPGSEIIRFLAGGPVMAVGDPIDPRMSALGRIGGKAGGLAKARKYSAA